MPSRKRKAESARERLDRGGFVVDARLVQSGTVGDLYLTAERALDAVGETMDRFHRLTGSRKNYFIGQTEVAWVRERMSNLRDGTGKLAKVGKSKAPLKESDRADLADLLARSGGLSDAEVGDASVMRVLGWCKAMLVALSGSVAADPKNAGLSEAFVAMAQKLHYVTRGK